jgi:ribosomal 30S subunit maturation factor RimM
VRDVEFPGAAPLLAVDTKDGEVLVPLAAEFCVRIDVNAKRIDVTLPEGLRDLNRG